MSAFVDFDGAFGTHMSKALREMQAIDARGKVIKANLGDRVAGPCITQAR